MSGKDSMLSSASVHSGTPRILLTLAFGMVLFAAIFASSTGLAYGHGCQAQGGCCTVGGSCVEITANSPIFMMFAVVGLGAVTMMAFYGKTVSKSRLGAIFNIFI